MDHPLSLVMLILRGAPGLSGALLVVSGALVDADLADLDAAYLVGFAGSQGFSDGNKRTGLACALVFLFLNGYALHVDPRELYAVTMQAALGKAEDETVAAYLRQRMTPR
jgi:death on curing protein